MLDEREQAGKVCRCHGDLHLRNIFLYQGEHRLFDCIEFNDHVARSDILYDLAFLTMDLSHRNEREQVDRLMNRYLDETDDEEGFPLLPFFIALRAAVRAHVLATQSTDASADQARILVEEARTYFTLASSSLEPELHPLLAIGGLRGTGKSTLAEAVAPLVGAVPGARTIESDRIPNRMHGVPPETQLPARAYLPKISARVYLEMAWRSRLILKSGGSVFADAIFDKLRHGIWLEADPALLRKRVASHPHGVSGADVGVLEKQLQHDLSDVTWPRLDASASIDALANQVLRVPTRQLWRLILQFRRQMLSPAALSAIYPSNMGRFLSGASCGCYRGQ